MDIEKETHDRALQITDKVVKQLHEKAIKKFRKNGNKLFSKHIIFIFKGSCWIFDDISWHDTKDMFQRASFEGCTVSLSRSVNDVMLTPGFTVHLELVK